MLWLEKLNSCCDAGMESRIKNAYFYENISLQL